MIYIICGTCGTSQGYKTAADGALSLPSDEEARLVRRGVAEYVTLPVIGGGDADVSQAEETEADDVPKLPENRAGTDELMQLTRSDLEKMAADFGVDTSKCRNKSEIAALLAAAELQGGDDAPPVPDAEGPDV